MMRKDMEYIINFSEKEIVEYWDCTYPLNIRAVVIPERTVVRCKDCKFYSTIRSINTTTDVCFNCLLLDRYMRPDDYCSYGERKENE